MFDTIRRIFGKHKNYGQSKPIPWLKFEKTRVMIRLWGLTLAELVDAWRLGPRMFVGGYAYMLWMTVQWYMLIPSTPTTPNMAQSALVSAVLGAASVIFAFYVNTGRRWGDNPNISNGAYESNMNLPVPNHVATPLPPTTEPTFAIPPQQPPPDQN